MAGTRTSHSSIFIHDEKIAVQFRKENIAPYMCSYVERVMLGPKGNVEAKAYFFAYLVKFLTSVFS